MTVDRFPATFVHRNRTCYKRSTQSFFRVLVEWIQLQSSTFVPFQNPSWRGLVKYLFVASLPLLTSQIHSDRDILIHVVKMSVKNLTTSSSLWPLMLGALE